MFWALVLTVCMSGGVCEEFVIDESDTLSNCIENMRLAQKDVLDMDRDNKYILACEQTEVE